MKTGKIIEGSVLDCNKKHLLKALKDYDKHLYLKWNPYKTYDNGNLEKLPLPGDPHYTGKSGIGVWELRRRPEKKLAVPKWELGESIIFNLEYVESDIVNHVMDLPALNYNCLVRLREMDTWEVQNYVSDLEYRESKALEAEYAKNRAELRYNVKHHKKAFEDFREYVRSGRNPTDLLIGDW